MHLVLGQVRHPEAVVDEHLLIALGDAHGGDDRARRVRAHQQVDLVHRDELLVERARDLGLGLIVEQHPLHRPAEKAVGSVQLLDVNLAGDLVEQRRRGERSGEGQRAPDPDRGPGRRRDRGGCPGDDEHRGDQAGETRRHSRADHERLRSVASPALTNRRARRWTSPGDTRARDYPCR